MYLSLKEELERKQSNNKQESMLRSILKTPLVQTYQYAFHNGQKVNIKILCLKDMELSEMVGEFAGSWIKVVEVLDESSWLQYICIRKQLNEIGVAQAIDPDILYGFDAIKCLSEQKLYGISAAKIAKSLASFILQAKGKVDKRLLVTEFKQIMNDLQALNITMGQNIDTVSLRMNQKQRICKPAIRVQPNFKNELMSLSQYAFFPQTANPYQRDVRHIQQLLQRVFNQSPKVEHASLFSIAQTNKITKIIDYATFVSKTSIRKWHEQLNHFQEIQQNLSFLNDLYCHFYVEGKNTDASLLLELQRGILTKSQSFKFNKKYLYEIDKLIKIQKSDERKYDQTNPRINYDILKKLYYNPLKKQPFNKSSQYCNIPELKKQINSTKPFSKAKKCNYHFLKAKQAWMNLNLTRSIAHLQKAFKYASTPQLKSKIHIEMGFIWSQLCEFDKAEKQYQYSLQIIQKMEGEESLRLFSLLQNIIILYSKMENNSKQTHFYRRLETIKKRFNNMQFYLMPNLMHSFSSTVLFGAPNISDMAGVQISKPIAKQDFLKMQIERIPSLEKIWQIVHVYLEKGDKDFNRDIDKYESLFEFGQLKMLYFIVKLIHNYQNDLDFNEMEQAAFIQTIQNAKRSNVKMYYRLIFLQSYKYERQNKIAKAIALMKTIMNSKVFSLAINNSLRKRILKLAKKGQIDADIKEIYADIDWLCNEGMIEELYNSVIYFQDTKDHLACMKSCKKYLQLIQDCQSPHDGFSKNSSKIVNHSIQVQMILGECLIEMNFISEAWEHLNTIPENRLDKQKTCHILSHFIQRAYEENQYWLCMKYYEKMFRFYTLRDLSPQKMKIVWIATAQSLLNCKYEYQSIENSLVYTYNNLPELQDLVGNTTIPVRLRELKSKNAIWQNFCLQIDIPACLTSLKSQADHSKKIKDEIAILCQRYSVQRGKDMMNQLCTILGEIDESQNHILIQHLVDVSMKMSLLKGNCSELVICLHAYLYQTVKSIGLHYQQVLLILWFSTLSKRLQDEWKTELWGSQTKQSNLDRLLFELFKMAPTERQSKIAKLWWVSSKERDLLKLWSLYTKIGSVDEITEDDQFTFKILCGSYHLHQQNLLVKEVQKRFPSNSIDQL